MRKLLPVGVRTLGWFLLFPVPFIGLLPWWLHHRFEGAFVWTGGWLQWVGAWLIANGLGLAGWCVVLFNVEGKGTPLPLDPPKAFVATGPYRFVRNPMMLGMFLLLAGQAAVYESKLVFLYLLLVIGAASLFVRFVEEPDLARRFGSSYQVYQRRVPRWWPRLISGAARPKTS